MNPKGIKVLFLVLSLKQFRDTFPKIESLVAIIICLNHLIGLPLLYHIYGVKSLLINFEVLLYMAYFYMLDVVQHVNETRISNLAETRFVELVPLCLQRLFVSEVKDRLCVVGI